MEFFRRAQGAPARLGILPGAFNPPTVAHLAIAQAALGAVDEVLFVLPRAFPHKPYELASFRDRVEMLLRATSGEPRYSVSASEGGLFLEIAAECRGHYAKQTQFALLCGRDAAERIAAWDYGSGPGFSDMLAGFELLVAARRGEYQAAAACRSRVGQLSLPGTFDEISATEVREKAAHGEPWRHLVPPAIADLVQKIYTREIIGRSEQPD